MAARDSRRNAAGGTEGGARRRSVRPIPLLDRDSSRFKLSRPALIGPPSPCCRRQAFACLIFGTNNKGSTMVRTMWGLGYCACAGGFSRRRRSAFARTSRERLRGGEREGRVRREES